MRGSKFSSLTARTRSGTLKIGVGAVLALAAWAPAAGAHAHHASRAAHAQRAPLMQPLGHKVG